MSIPLVDSPARLRTLHCCAGLHQPASQLEKPQENPPSPRGAPAPTGNFSLHLFLYFHPSWWVILENTDPPLKKPLTFSFLSKKAFGSISNIKEDNAITALSSRLPAFLATSAMVSVVALPGNTGLVITESIYIFSSLILSNYN